MVIPAAGRAYNIPAARDHKRWNLSIFLGNQPWGPTWLCILFFCLKVGYSRTPLQRTLTGPGLPVRPTGVLFVCRGSLIKAEAGSSLGKGGGCTFNFLTQVSDSEKLGNNSSIF